MKTKGKVDRLIAFLLPPTHSYVAYGFDRKNPVVPFR